MAMVIVKRLSTGVELSCFILPPIFPSRNWKTCRRGSSSATNGLPTVLSFVKPWLCGYPEGPTLTCPFQVTTEPFIVECQPVWPALISYIHFNVSCRYLTLLLGFLESSTFWMALGFAAMHPASQLRLYSSGNQEESGVPVPVSFKTIGLIARWWNIIRCHATRCNLKFFYWSKLRTLGSLGTHGDTIVYRLIGRNKSGMISAGLSNAHRTPYLWRQEIWGWRAVLDPLGNSFQVMLVLANSSKHWPKWPKWASLKSASLPPNQGVFRPSAGFSDIGSAVPVPRFFS